MLFPRAKYLMQSQGNFLFFKLINYFCLTWSNALKGTYESPLVELREQFLKFMNNGTRK